MFFFYSENNSDLYFYLPESIPETSKAHDTFPHKEKPRQDTQQVKGSLGQPQI